MHFLVNSVKGNIQEELVIALYREEEFGDMLRQYASPPSNHASPASNRRRRKPLRQLPCMATCLV